VSDKNPNIIPNEEKEIAEGRTLRISSALYNDLYEEQHQVKKRTGRKLTLGFLLEQRLKKARENSQILYEGKSPPLQIVRYDTSHVARAAQKTVNAVKVLADVMTELQGAAPQGEDVITADSAGSEIGQLIRTAAAQIEDELGTLNASAKELQSRAENAGKAKQVRHRKLPGGRT
jgi:hypothetical protein